MAFGEKCLLEILLGRFEISSGVSFLEVLAGKGAEKHLCRVPSAFLPSKRLRLVEKGGEEVGKGGTVGDSFDEHLVLLLWVAVGMLVLEVQPEICEGEPVHSRRVDTVEGCRSVRQSSHLLIQLACQVPCLEAADYDRDKGAFL